MSHYGKSHVILKPHNSIIYDWVESSEKKWEKGRAHISDKSTRKSKIAWLDPPSIIKTLSDFLFFNFIFYPNIFSPNNVLLIIFLLLP